MGGHWGGPGDPRGGLWGTCGSQGGSWESLGVAWGALGSPCGDLGVPWGGAKGPLGGSWGSLLGLLGHRKIIEKPCVFLYFRNIADSGGHWGAPRGSKGTQGETKGGPRRAQVGTCGRLTEPKGVRGGGFETPLGLERPRACFFEFSGVHY